MDFLARYIASPDAEHSSYDQPEFFRLSENLVKRLKSLSIFSKYDTIIYFMIIVNPERGDWNSKEISYRHIDKSIYLKYQANFERWKIANQIEKYEIFCRGLVNMVFKIKDSAINRDDKENILKYIILYSIEEGVDLKF